MKKKNIDSCLRLYTKVNSRWVTDLNIKAKTIQHLRENIDYFHNNKNLKREEN